MATSNRIRSLRARACALSLIAITLAAASSPTPALLRTGNIWTTRINVCFTDQARQNQHFAILSRLMINAVLETWGSIV